MTLSDFKLMHSRDTLQIQGAHRPTPCQPRGRKLHPSPDTDVIHPHPWRGPKTTHLAACLENPHTGQQWGWQ